MNKVKTRTAEIWKDDKGIIWLQVLEGAAIDKEDAADNLLVVKNLSDNKPVLRILDSRNKWNISNEAKEYTETAFKHTNTVAYAVLVNSFTDKILRNFILNFNRPDMPVKTFTNETEAITWLLAFKK